MLGRRSEGQGSKEVQRSRQLNKAGKIDLFQSFYLPVKMKIGSYAVSARKLDNVNNTVQY